MAMEEEGRSVEKYDSPQSGLITLGVLFGMCSGTAPKIHNKVGLPTEERSIAAHGGVLNTCHNTLGCWSVLTVPP